MTIPINRAPFTALVDDDGSNTIGSPWNKSAIAGTLLDPMDAARVWTAVQVAGLGTDVVDWNPGIVGDTVITLAGLTAGGTSTIYGFKPAAPAYPGQRIVIHTVNDPAALVTFFHEYTGGSLNCMLRCRQAPAVTIKGYWAWAEFQYATYNGVGAWLLGGYGNGIGG